MNEIVIEVDVLKTDGQGKVALLDRVNLPAIYSDSCGSFVATYKNNRQQVQGNHDKGFYITIF